MNARELNKEITKARRFLPADLDEVEEAYELLEDAIYELEERD